MNDAPVTIETSEGIESPSRSTHRSGLPPRIEVITRGARRSWPLEQKRQIVAESLAPGARPNEIIRKYGIGSGQLSIWRRQFATRLADEVAGPAARFARVDVVASRRQPNPPLPGASARAASLIEIVLPNGTLVRVGAHVDDRALRCVLEALHGR
jgi:transposase